MKTIVIKEFETETKDVDFILDLTNQTIKDCIGCWTCWLKKPGHCVHHDLDDFYRAFFNSNCAVFLIQPVFGFISGNLKTMLDRMLPGSMPFIRYNKGESMHQPRYSHTPNIKIYYQDTFDNEEDRQLFFDYMSRTMYHFSFKLDFIKPWKGDLEL